MSDRGPETSIVDRWYARPVFFVDDVNRAARFYTDKLGFVKKWHEADGAGTVCQVDRSECEIILCQDTRRRDRTRLFIELAPDGVAELQRELAENALPTTRAWWGYDVLRIEDPDGNELLIPLQP